jgi:hypothetical protein
MLAHKRFRVIINLERRSNYITKLITTLYSRAYLVCSTNNKEEKNDGANYS